MFSRFISPFRALLYNRSKLDDVSKVICPPYDVIEDPEIYYARSPYNAVRLELPLGEDRYEKAKMTLERWIGEGILVEDERDSIYVMEQDFTFEGKRGRRVGFFSLVLSDEAKILTHERIKREPKEDRKNLISKTKAFFSFIFGLYEDPSYEIDSIISSERRERIFEFEDDFGVKTEVYRISDETSISRLAELLSAKNIYLADGHHRLQVAYELKLRQIPMYLTNLYGDGLRIAPYHRLARVEKKRRDLGLKMLSERYHLKRIRPSMESLMKELEEGRFGLLMREEKDQVYIFELNSEDGSFGSKVTYAHEVILKDELGVEEDYIAFTPYLTKAFESVQKGDYDLSLLFPPAKIEDVKKVADSGSFLPPKSTYFFPKVPSGPIFFKYG